MTAIKERRKECSIILGEETHTIHRLSTRDGLNIGSTILGYGRKLQGPLTKWLPEFGREGRSNEENIEVGLALLGDLSDILDAEDLLRVGAATLGLPLETVAEAPLEDVLNAVADAFELNSMPAILDACRRIWESGRRLAGRASAGANTP